MADRVEVIGEDRAMLESNLSALMPPIRDCIFYGKSNHGKSVTPLGSKAKNSGGVGAEPPHYLIPDKTKGIIIYIA